MIGSEERHGGRFGTLESRSFEARRGQHQTQKRKRQKLLAEKRRFNKSWNERKTDLKLAASKEANRIREREEK